jgi:hypothetical protein
MEWRDWLAVGTMVVAASVPLIAMRWKVRSERQIALFQRGLVTEVKPPVSWWWFWLWDGVQKMLPWMYALVVTFAVSELVKQTRSAEPVTRGAVVWIAYNAAMVVFMFVNWWVGMCFRYIGQLFEKDRERAEQHRATLDLMRNLGEMVAELRKEAATRG